VVEGDGDVYIKGRLVINDRPRCLVIVLHYNALDAVLVRPSLRPLLRHNFTCRTIYGSIVSQLLVRLLNAERLKQK
jgi:hypothetical protein